MEEKVRSCETLRPQPCGSPAEPCPSLGEWAIAGLLTCSSEAELQLFLGVRGDQTPFTGLCPPETPTTSRHQT